MGERKKPCGIMILGGTTFSPTVGGSLLMFLDRNIHHVVKLLDFCFFRGKRPYLVITMNNKWAPFLDIEPIIVWQAKQNLKKQDYQ